jgi:hypothetical protein
LRSKVTTETRLNASTKDLWLVSPQGDSTDTGLMVMTLQEEPLSPDSFVMANWSRLDSSPWMYDHNPSRSFTLQPYSINDSAIGITWDPRPIPRAGKREAVLLLGNRNQGGFAMESNASSFADLFDAAVLTGADKASLETAIQLDLLTVRDLIDKINKRIESGVEVSEEELTVMGQILEDWPRGRPHTRTADGKDGLRARLQGIRSFLMA